MLKGEEVGSDKKTGSSGSAFAKATARQALTPPFAPFAPGKVFGFYVKNGRPGGASLPLRLFAAIYSLADGDATKACPDQLQPPAAWIPRVQGSCWLSKA